MTAGPYMAAALVAFAFRAAPFVVFALAGRSVSPRARFLALAAFAGVLAMAHALGASLDEVLLVAPPALAYFGLVGVLVHWLPSQVRRGRLGRWSLFGVLGVLHVLVPAWLVRSPLVIPAIVLGWEILLSAYSYCVECARSGDSPSRSECLFFLLVDPTFVYPERGRMLGAPGTTAKGASRCALGLVMWTTQFALAGVLSEQHLMGQPQTLSATSIPSYPAFLAEYSTLFLAYYIAHSGLASVQIGLMGVAGYSVPERYHYPFLASSPQDFWRRWNIWVGSWARRYLFLPLVFHAKRRWRRGRFGIGEAFAIVGTFAGVGLLHDLARYASELASPGGPPIRPTGTVLFLGLGILMIAWSVAGRGVGRLRRRALPPSLVTTAKVIVLFHALYLTHAVTMISLAV